jgi:GT2 family glycosyltransferase/glycosyltransferase involved in cell wall biosynthesis
MPLIFNGKVLLSAKEGININALSLRRGSEDLPMGEISQRDRWLTFPVMMSLREFQDETVEAVPSHTMKSWHIPGISGSCIWFRNREDPASVKIAEPVTVPVDLDRLHLLCDLGLHRSVAELVVVIHDPSGEVSTLRQDFDSYHMGGQKIADFQNVELDIGAVAAGSVIELSVNFKSCTAPDSSFDPCLLVSRPRLVASPSGHSRALTPVSIGSDDPADTRFFAAELPMRWRRFPLDLTLVHGAQETALCPEALKSLEFQLSRSLDLSVSSPASLALTLWSRGKFATLLGVWDDADTLLSAGMSVETLRDKSGSFILWSDVLGASTSADGNVDPKAPTHGNARFSHSLTPQDHHSVLLFRQTDDRQIVQASAVEAERRVVIYVCYASPQPASALATATVTVGDVVHDVAFTPLPEAGAELPTDMEDDQPAAASVYRCNLPCLFGEGRETVVIRWDDRDLFVGELQLSSITDGRIEGYDNGTLRGWAVDFRQPGEPAELEIGFNGVFYDHRRADSPRQDVESLFPGFPRTGFKLNFDPNLLSQPNLRPDVRVKGSSKSLRSKLRAIPGGHSAQPAPQTLFTAEPVSIIMPIYNACDDVRVCIESILKHTALSADGNQLILANDASPDPNIRPLLDSYAHLLGVTVLHQEKNLGYTANINAAMTLCPGRDVVLLNSDTQVTPQWLSLLQRAARQRTSIGTVTAVSDNAGAFSVPTRNAANPIPPWVERDDFARQITQNSHLEHFRVPTGSGFCMYIREPMIRDIGLFDDTTFPRGYGEENDYCMRGLHAGWEHVLADNVMIYHERSKSFLGEKETLMEKANELVPEMYPEYSLAVGRAFAANPPMKAMRYRAAVSRLREPTIALPRVAYVIGVDSGGTPQTNMDLMSTVQDEYAPFLLLCSTGQLTIFEIKGNQRHKVETIALSPSVEPISHDSPAYRAVIADVLQRYAFELVHIRHIGRHGLSIISTAKVLDIPVIFSLHDFYAVCPNIKLLDAQNRYCGGTCTAGDEGGDCNVELWGKGTTPQLKHGWIKSWQTVFRRILHSCDRLITTSPFARDLVKSHYGLKNIPFDVIPHARDFPRMERLGRTPQEGEPLRIFVPGNLAPAKGLDLIKEISALDVHGEIEFHFAGIAPEDLSPYGVYHGRYKREKIGDLIRKIDPHIGGVLAIWPETYSHTVTEMWAAGLPIVTTTLGATGERIAKHGGGWALEDMSAENVFAHLQSLTRNPDDINDRVNEVYDWQSGYGRNYTVPIMAERYKRLYRETMAARRTATPGTEVYLVATGEQQGPTGTTPGTAHLAPVLDKLVGPHHLSIWPSGYLALMDEIEAPETLVIRYHGPSRQHSLVDTLKAHPKLRIVVDIAPNCPPSAWEYDTMDPVLGYLLERADQVVAPASFTAQVDQIPPMDLSDAFVGEHDLNAHLERLAERASASIAPVQATTTSSPFNADRLENEVMPGSSAFVTRHNALLVDANFSLIDWRGMLTRPRTPGMVSIVVPVFNRVAITQQMIQSVLRTTPQDRAYEIIVVDNGSNLEVSRQLRPLGQMDPRVRLIRSDMQLMFSVGCNYGASFAQGEYILFMNNDMLVRNPEWLSQIIDPLETREDIGIVGSRLLYEDLTVQHAGIVFNAASKFPYHIYKGMAQDSNCVLQPREMKAVTGACLAMRASDWAKLRGFSPLYVNGSEDIDLCLRMSAVLGRSVYYAPEPTIIHLEGKSPGRGQANVHNRQVFLGLWGDKVEADDVEFYRNDKVAMPTFTSLDQRLNRDYRSVQPVV